MKPSPEVCRYSMRFAGSLFLAEQFHSGGQSEMVAKKKKKKENVTYYISCTLSKKEQNPHTLLTVKEKKETIKKTVFSLC